MPSSTFTGSRALVTGASSGIGAALARELAARGHPLILVARRRTALEELAASLPVPTEVVVADLATPDGLAHVEDVITAADEPVRLLVNNAGTGVFAPLAEQDRSAVDATVHVNVLAPTRLARAALPRMTAAGGGGIIVMSSPASVGFAGLTPYAASKAFLTTLGSSLAEEVAASGVLVTTAAPGYTRTEFHDRLGQDVSDIPREWWATPEQVATATLDAHAAGLRWTAAAPPDERSLPRKVASKAYRRVRRLTRESYRRFRAS